MNWDQLQFLGMLQNRRRASAGDILIGAAVGAVGGLVGAWAMNQTQKLAQYTEQWIGSDSSDRADHADRANSSGVCQLEPGNPAEYTSGGWPAREFNAEFGDVEASEREGRAERADPGGQPQGGQSGQQHEPATVATAEAVSETVFHHELSHREKEIAGPAVHFGFGALMGGVYGALAEVSPPVTTGAGTGFAASLWLLADEIAIPALGLGKPPQKTRPKTHVQALSAHLVYGATVEVVRRLLRKII
jgi:hypothetical protein